jgi:hypothetical protein
MDGWQYVILVKKNIIDDAILALENVIVNQHGHLQEDDESLIMDAISKLYTALGGISDSEDAIIEIN